jgi:hypothetical protein
LFQLVPNSYKRNAVVNEPPLIPQLFAGAKIKRFAQILQNIMQAAGTLAEFSKFFNISENKRYLAD